MSFNEETDRMDWKDEFIWILISISSGIILSLLFFYFRRFPDVNGLILTLINSTGFYFISIIIRIQNHRGQALTGKPAFDEKKLKFIFPFIGFALGIAFLIF